MSSDVIRLIVIMLAVMTLCVPAAPAVSETIVLTMKDRQFRPDEVKIKTGDTIEWFNDDQDVHQVISGKDLQDPSLGKPLDSGTLLPGQRYAATFSKPGTYPYMCVIHWSLQSITGKGGMVGEVIVEP
jgi:plastocyanin